MKKFFYTIFVFLCVACNNSHKQTVHYKSILEENFLYENSTIGEKSPALPFDSQSEFNEDGMLAKKTFFMPDGSIKEAFLYEYKDGNEIKQTKYDATQSVERIYLSEYDCNGKLIAYTTKSALGNVLYTSQYSRNKNQETEISYLPNGTQNYTIQSEYDNANHKTKEVWSCGDFSTITTTYTYVDDLLETQTEDNNGSVTKWTFSYDEHHNLLSQKCEYSDGSVAAENYTYTYNQQGDWIERICVGDFNVPYITKRKIECYE